MYALKAGSWFHKAKKVKPVKARTIVQITQDKAVDENSSLGL